jgi:hypothetical protein
MPASVQAALTNLAALQLQVNSGGGGGAKLIRSGDLLYVVTPWTDGSNMVQKVSLNLVSGDPVEMVSVGLISGQVSDAAVPGATPLMLQSTEDDITPAFFNGSYMGGNHGCSDVREITVPGHGKTTVDIGSEWVDANQHKFYLIKIVDANTLWVLSVNRSTSAVWSFRTTIDGNLLTVSTNAVHTNAMAITASTFAYLKPAIKNQAKKVLLNGRTEVVQDGVYPCESVTVVNSYDITDVAAILNYVKSHVGGAAAPAFDAPSIANVARMTVSYQFNNNGSCTVFHSFLTYEPISLGYLGFVQAQALAYPAGGSLLEYIPGTRDLAVGSSTYSFTNLVDITGLTNTINVTPAYWLDTNAPLPTVKMKRILKKALSRLT